jgi:predicted DNA-binding transcriptional regulator YafY
MVVTGARVDARSRREALLGWLRGRGSATAEQIAERFEVSLRTAHRDVAALRELGEPIDADPGRGGGFRLDPLRSLPAVRFDVDEVVGLVMASALAVGSGAPFGGDARRAVDRAVSTLPASRAGELRRVLSRIIVGPPASYAVVGALGPIAEDVLRAFEAAFTARKALGFEYVDRNGQRTERRVEPHGLLAQAPAWYLLAYDLDREAPRLFRLDRMHRPTLRSEGFVPDPQRVFVPLVQDVHGARPAIEISAATAPSARPGPGASAR